MLYVFEKVCFSGELRCFVTKLTVLAIFFSLPKKESLFCRRLNTFIRWQDMFSEGCSWLSLGTLSLSMPTALLSPHNKLICFAISLCMQRIWGRVETEEGNLGTAQNKRLQHGLHQLGQCVLNETYPVCGHFSLICSVSTVKTRLKVGQRREKHTWVVTKNMFSFQKWIEHFSIDNKTQTNTQEEKKTECCGSDFELTIYPHYVHRNLVSHRATPGLTAAGETTEEN